MQANKQVVLFPGTAGVSPAFHGGDTCADSRRDACGPREERALIAKDARLGIRDACDPREEPITNEERIIN